MFWKKKLPNRAKYKCSICNEIHEEWPALTFNSPSSYHELTENEKASIAKIESDFCTITYKDQIDRFIRVVLKQKVNDIDQDLEYGLWVSLSEKSFTDYYGNFNNENHQQQYFGWLNSRIPEYENTLSIPTTVNTKSGNDRPEIIPHNDFDHEFVKDYYNGISRKEAEKRIHEMMKNAG